MAVDDAVDAVAERSRSRSLGQRQLESALLGARYQRSRERVCGESVERGSETERLVAGNAVEGDDVARAPDGRA